MKNEKMTHERYVELKNKNEIDHFFNLEKVAEYSCDFLGDKKISETMRKFLKFKKRESGIWIFSLVSLFTPLRLLFVCAIIYSVLSYFFGRMTTRFLLSKMYDSKEFYDYVVTESNVVIPMFVGKKDGDKQ